MTDPDAMEGSERTSVNGEGQLPNDPLEPGATTIEGKAH